LDEVRRAEAEAEQKRNAAAYRLFQPKLVLVAQYYIDSIGIRGAAHQALLDEMAPVARDIFLASPNASETKIKEDLRPLFVKYSERSKNATRELGRWIGANRQRLTGLGEKAQQVLATSVDAEYNRLVAGKAVTLDTQAFDENLKGFERNRNFCLALNDECDELLLSSSQRLSYKQLLANATNRRRRDSSAVVPLAVSFVSQRGSWPSSIAFLIADRVHQKLRAAPIGKPVSVAFLIQAEGEVVAAAIGDCVSGRSCSRTAVDAVTYSRYAALRSKAFKQVCSGLQISECKAILIFSDSAGETVRSGGSEVGKTPHIMQLLAGNDIRISVGDSSTRVDTVVRFFGESPEVHVNFRRIHDPSRLAAPSRATIELSLASELPKAIQVAPFTARPPAKLSPVRVASVWAIGIPLIGAISAASYDKELSTPSQAFKDGAVIGALGMSVITWATYRSIAKETKAYAAKKQLYERSIAARDSALLRRSKIVDSVLAAEVERLRSTRPSGAISIIYDPK
jgi:hypothetical protein